MNFAGNWKKACGAAAAGLICAGLLYAFASGPPPRYTGAPGDNASACAACHTGTALNGGPGKVTIQFPNGETYTPGQSQTLTVTVSDPAAKVYGFQLTARLSTNPSNGQAGDFAAGSGQKVICDDGSIKSATGCPAKSPVEFIEHDTPSATGVWQLTWTPPATDVGDVYLYIAGNAANGDGTPFGDHIYTAHYTLAPGPGTGSKPSITQAGVVSNTSFDPTAGLAPGTWLEIYGSNLSVTTRQWGTADFKGFVAPTAVNGVNVNIDGIPAFVEYVSPGQVNVQVPQDNTVGPVQVVVTNPDGASDPVTVQMAAVAPALLAPPSFNVNGKQYVVAQFQDGVYVGTTGLIKGIASRPASPGDTISIYGIGFGPVTGNIVPGEIPNQLNSLLTAPRILFGETSAEFSYDGLVPVFIGEYQFNITVPDVGSGDVPFSMSVGGVGAQSNLFITIK